MKQHPPRKCIVARVNVPQKQCSLCGVMPSIETVPYSLLWKLSDFIETVAEHFSVVALHLSWAEECVHITATCFILPFLKLELPNILCLFKNKFTEILRKVFFFPSYVVL